MSLLNDDRSLSLDSKARSDSSAPFAVGGYEGENEDEGDIDSFFAGSGRKEKGRVRSGEASDWQKTSGFSLRRKKDKSKEKEGVGGVKGRIKTKTPPESPSRKHHPEVVPTAVPRKGKTNPGQSSPNLKTNRKIYSHLLENDFSSGGEEEDEDNFLLSKGHVAKEKRQSAVTGDIPSFTNQTMFAAFDTPLAEVGTSSNSTQFPVKFSPPKEARFPTFSGGSFDIETAEYDLDNLVEGLPSPETIHHPFPSLPPPPSAQQQQTTPSFRPLQLEPTATVATTTVATTTTTDDDAWSISDELRQRCVQQFQSLLPEKGLLSGEKSRDFFIQSRLPRDQLSKIWKLSDVDHDGCLNLEEFIIAMKLVMMRRNDHPIPSVLPDSLKPKPIVPQSSHKLRFSIPPPPPSTTDSASHPSPIFSAHSKTEPSVATSEVQPASKAPPPPVPKTVDHVTVGDSVYAVVNKNSDNKEENLMFSNMHSSIETSVTDSLLQEKDSNVMDHPTVTRLIGGQGEESTGEEDEMLVLVPGEGAPVPKPRKRKKTVGKADKPESQLQRGHTIHGRPPPKPAPYVRRSASPPPLDVSSDTHSVRSVSPTRDDTAPMIKSDELVQAKTKLKTHHSKPLVVEVPTSDTTKSGVNFVKLKEEGDTVKSHGRSVSWDLSKMLNELGIEIHEDLPTAEPPKPPPRRSMANSDDEREEPKFDKLAPLQKSASTGSLNSIGSAVSKPRSPTYDSLEPEQPLIQRTPTIARRPAPAPPPQKPALAPKPKKPPPPKKPISILNPSPTKEVSSDNPDETPLLSAETYLRKNKIELQKSIKILKEETNMFSKMNSELQIKLNELRQERVSLQAKLDALSSLA